MVQNQNREIYLCFLNTRSINFIPISQVIGYNVDGLKISQLKKLVWGHMENKTIFEDSFDIYFEIL